MIDFFVLPCWIGDVGYLAGREWYCHEYCGAVLHTALSNTGFDSVHYGVLT